MTHDTSSQPPPPLSVVLAGGGGVGSVIGVVIATPGLLFDELEWLVVVDGDDDVVLGVDLCCVVVVVLGVGVVDFVGVVDVGGVVGVLSAFAAEPVSAAATCAAEPVFAVSGLSAFALLSLSAESVLGGSALATVVSFLPLFISITIITIATTASRLTAPIIRYSSLLSRPRPTDGTITAGSENPPPPNTGRSSIEPIADDVAGLPIDAPPPMYALAIERISMRPEPSPPAAPVAWPELCDDGVEIAGLSLASCARLLSENKTEFSLRSPRSFELAADAELAAAAAGLPPNR